MAWDVGVRERQHNQRTDATGSPSRLDSGGVQGGTFVREYVARRFEPDFNSGPHMAKIA